MKIQTNFKVMENYASNKYVESGGVHRQFIASILGCTRKVHCPTNCANSNHNLIYLHIAS